jgi:hypothetical protein
MFIKLFKRNASGMQGHRDYKEWHTPLLIKKDIITGYTDYMIYFDTQAVKVEESCIEIEKILAKAK